MSQIHLAVLVSRVRRLKYRRYRYRIPPRARARADGAKRECFKERVIYIRGPSAHGGDFMCLSGNGRYEAINFKNPARRLALSPRCET